MSLSLTRRDVFWGYAAQFLNISAGLLLLPLIVRFLTPEEVGFWFVFLALASFAQLMELGFQPTIARNAAYVYAGAQHLQPVGLAPSSQSSPVNVQLLADLLASARRIYVRVAIAAALVMFGAGSAYLYSLVPPDYPWRNVCAGWLAFSAGYVITFLYGFYNGLLQGRGDITAVNKSIVASRVVLVVCGAIALASGYGLLGVGIAALCSSVIGRLMVYRYFYVAQRPATSQLKEQEKVRPTLTKTLWHNAGRLGLASIAAFLILRSSVLIASSFLGLEAAASYGLSLQLLVALSGMASMFANLQLPRMNALQMSGKREELRRSYGAAMLSAWVIYSFGAFLIVAYGPYLLELVGSNTQLISSHPLAFLALIMLLEMNHSISALYLTTLNVVPYVGAAIWSGIAIVGLNITLVIATELGILGLVFGQGIVQIAYNNWKWPKEALKHLDCGFGHLVRSGWTQLGILIGGKTK